MISVCVLSYERPDSLVRCLGSLFAQEGCGLVEIIVGDDGTLDDSVRSDLAGLVSDSMISATLLCPPGHNEGVGRMVNRLFGLASGDYLVKADQDLVFERGALASMKHVLDAEPDVGTVGGFRYWHDPVDHRDMFLAERASCHLVRDYVSSAMMVRRGEWEHYGPWIEHSPAFAEDMDFKHRMAHDGWAHALPRRDVIVNDGFGIGPSTVVTAAGTTAPIHDRPLALGTTLPNG